MKAWGDGGRALLYFLIILLKTHPPKKGLNVTFRRLYTEVTSSCQDSSKSVSSVKLGCAETLIFFFKKNGQSSLVAPRV